MSIKLKPCPLCGGKAELDNDDLCYWVNCKECGASVDTGYIKSDVAKAWNKRVREDSGLVDELVGALELSLCEMETWKSLDLCDCPPEGHLCGIRRLEQSISTTKRALVRAKKGVE